MAKVLSNSKVEMTVTLVLTEVEARALAIMPCYGAKAFLEGYYKHLGKHYMKPYEQGIIDLFDSINRQLPAHIRKADAARKAFTEAE